MSALPKPDLPPGPHRDLVDALHELHHRAGWPSLRTLAREAGCSHTTVSAVFSSPKLPGWGVLELLVEAMDGDVATFRDLWLAASSPSSGTRPPTPQIAGRKAELAAVRRHLESGTGLLLVTGEAGIGKTKLVGAAAAATPGTFTAAGAALPLSRQVPLLPVIDALRALHDLDRGQWLKEALTDCPPYVRDALRRPLPELDPRFEPAVPEPDDEWSRHRLFTALRAVLTASSELRGLAVLLEDLHWADSSTLDLLEHLVAGDLAVPILGTWRTGDPATPEATTAWLGRLRRTGTVGEVALGPLTRGQTADQLSQMGTRLFSPAEVDRIHRRSQGQPLFTQQLAAEWDRGGNGVLPPVLSDLLDRRFQGLAGAAWLIATALATADRPLPEPLLATVSGLPRKAMVAGLRELADHHLLTPPSGHDVELGHPLLAEAIRRRMVVTETTDAHRRLAMTLSVEEHPSAAEVALHWRRAGDATEELLWTVRAARAAADRFATEEAIGLWVRALKIWAPDQRVDPGDGNELEKVDAYITVLDAMVLRRAFAEARPLADQGLAEFPDLTPSKRADLLRLSSNAALTATLDYRQSSRRRIEEAIGLYRTLPPSEALVDALEFRAALMVSSGDRDGALTSMREAVDILHRLPASPFLRELLVFAAWNMASMGDLSAAQTHMASARTMVPTKPEPQRDLVAALLHTDIMLMANATAEQVEAAAREALEGADVWGIDDVEVATTRANVCEAWVREGQVRRAVSSIEPYQDEPVSWDNRRAQEMRAIICMLQGRFDAARSRCEDLLTLGDTADPLEAARLVVDLDAWQGLSSGAAEALLLDLERGDGAALGPGYLGLTLLSLARALADQAHGSPVTRRRDLVLRLRRLERALAPFTSQELPADLVCTPQWQAELDRLADQDTMEAWVAAASTWDRVPRPHDAAYCRWRGAQVAITSGRRSAAGKLLRRAARDAREHVPLSRAIAETASSVQSGTSMSRTS